MDLFYWNSLKSNTWHGNMLHIDGPLTNSVFDFIIVFTKHPMPYSFHIVETCCNTELFVSLWPFLSRSSLVYPAVSQAVADLLPYSCAAVKSIISPIFQIINWSRGIWIVTSTTKFGRWVRQQWTAIPQALLAHSTALPGVRCGWESPAPRRDECSLHLEAGAQPSGQQRPRGMALGEWVCEVTQAKGPERRPMPFAFPPQGAVWSAQPPCVTATLVSCPAPGPAHLGRAIAGKKLVLASFIRGSERK